MNHPTRARRLWPLLAALTAACGGGGSSNPDVTDTSTPTDTPSTDAADTGNPPDAQPDTGLDAQPDGGGDGQVQDAPQDVSTDAGTCNGLPIENLNALGTLQGSVLHFSGTNADSTATSTQGVQIPQLSNLINFCNYRSGHQRVFSYTTQTASVLRVSTSNPGTSYGFDTTLTIIDKPCTSTRTFLGCNDDDLAFNGDERHISSTSITFVQIAAGATVYIAVGGFVPVTGTPTNPEGETGTFELTVQELAPKAEGSACDVKRLDDACADNATCVSDLYPSESGHCRADGSVAGAACGTGCTGTGLTCDANSGLCVAGNVAAGQTCDPFHQCGAGLGCDALQRGAASGTCRAEGTAVGLACGASGACNSGLACSVPGGPGVCLRAAPSGGACNTFDSVCPTGETCVGGENFGTQGTCTPVGTVAGAACDTSGACTGTGLSCTTQGTTQVCTDIAATGSACAFFDVCEAGGTCYLTDPTVRITGVCFAPGTLGGACLSGNTCNTGTCSNGRCVNTGTLGGSCDLATDCPTGSSCLRQGSGTFMGSCVAEGTVAGAGCRGQGMACDNGLTCSSPFAGDGVCQSAGTGACDPLTATVACPAGQVCRSTGLSTGSCATPTAETEPNDTVATSLATVTVPAAISGSLTTGDIDCFAVAVPANGKLYAAASSPAGLCPGQLQLDVYQLNAGALELIGSDQDSSSFGCPRVDGTDTSGVFDWARNLSAGTYYVCLRDQNGNPVNDYALSLNAAP